MTIEAIDYNNINNNSTPNQYANFWRYCIGINIIPAVGKLKIPKVKWEQYQDAPIPQWQHEEWIKNNMFNEGMAIIMGKVWHNKDFEGCYIFGIDCDNTIAIDEFLTLSDGRKNTIQDFAKKTVVEQHLDNKNKMHFYGYTNQAVVLRDKTSDIGKQGMDPSTMPAFEVKATSDFLMYCAPSRHKDGHKYQIIGSLIPFKIDDNSAIKLQEKIDGICSKYGLYTGSNSNDNKLPIEELFKPGNPTQAGHNRHERLLRKMDSLIQRNKNILPLDQIKKMAMEVNQNPEYFNPPLDDSEFEKQWECATEFIGRSGYEDNGYKNNNSESTKGNESEEEKESKPKEYSVYKYSKGIPLAEQIILENKSVFLQIINDKPTISTEIDLSENQNIILKPHQHGISGVASPILPIKFKNLEEIEYFIEQAKKETIDSLYLRHKSLWKRLIVTQNESETIFLAMDSVYSQFQDMFETTHYDLLYGDPGSGKGAKLITFKLLGYRVVLAADLSGANILDLYGSTEICQITIAEDEMDDIHKDADKHKIYKIGYDFTGTTTRTLDGSTSNRNLTLYSVFGLKLFGTESAPDDKKLGGFNDRTFRQPSIKGKAEFVVKKILRIIQEEIPIERQLQKYQGIVKDVDYARKLSLMFRMLHHEDLIEEVEINIDGRPLELTGPQLYLFTSRKLGSSYLDTPKDERKNTLVEKEIIPTLSTFLRQKGQLAKKTIESVVYEALKELMLTNKPKIIVDVTGKQIQLFTLSYEAVYATIRELTDGIPSTKPNEQAFYSDEYGKVTHRQVLKICRNRFLGENDTIGSMRDKTKALTFDKETVDKVGKGFEVIIKIEILSQDDIGTEGRNWTSYKDIGENIENGPINQSSEHENPTDSGTELNKNILSTPTIQNSVPPSLNTEIEHENGSKDRDGIGTELNSDSDSVPTNSNNGNISRVYPNSDRWKCDNCKVVDDRYAMENHDCSGSLKK